MHMLAINIEHNLDVENQYQDPCKVVLYVYKWFTTLKMAYFLPAISDMPLINIFLPYSLFCSYLSELQNRTKCGVLLFIIFAT